MPNPLAPFLDYLQSNSSLSPFSGLSGGLLGNLGNQFNVPMLNQIPTANQAMQTFATFGSNPVSNYLSSAGHGTLPGGFGSGFSGGDFAKQAVGLLAKPSIVGRPLAGAASGAASGAGIGSMIAPGIGTAIGAGVGGLAGLMGGKGGAQQRQGPVTSIPMQGYNPYGGGYG